MPIVLFLLATHAHSLKPLKHSNPGLVVDLAVGW